MQKQSRTKQIRLILFSLVLCLAGLLVFFSYKGVFLSENQAFDRFTSQLFREEMSGNTLSLHYTLAYPEKYGIKNTSVTLGRISPEAFEDDCTTLKNTLSVLSDFDYNKLSEKNQLTFDILKLSIQTRLSLKNNYMLLEPLSPNLGIQAQLPVLLAEYTFRTSDDIRNYLSLLASIPGYFEEILKFEQEKSRQGFFMNDRFAERVSEQCSRFADSSSDYLTDMFTEKMSSFLASKKITRTQYDRFLKLHKKIMVEKVFPAYQNLQEGLTALKGTGKNENGLVHLSGGLSYYQYLIRSDTGDYHSLPEIEKRLYKQFFTDYKKMQTLLGENEDLKKETESLSALSVPDPSKVLAHLNSAITERFPPLPKTSYSVKYVPKALEEFSSPAFYLTPPIDTLSPNIIYINQASKTSALERFTTLAHEGFPGHLYQTLYFSHEDVPLIRHALNFSGYIEGWATFVEAKSYDYAAGYLNLNPKLTQAMWLNRSVTLCLYSILDMGIHYRGWNIETVSRLLSSFGLADENIQKEIFQYIIENPANYLKYYLGYINLIDLEEKVRTENPNAFSEKGFHRKLLEIGPAQFPIIEKYMLKN